MADLFRRQPGRLRSCNLVRSATADAENAIALGFFEATASGPVSATFSVTEASDTLVAAGSTASGVTASAALTEAGDVVSATARLFIAGSVALSEAGDSLTSSARLAIVATVSLSEASDTLASTSRLLIAGSFIASESPDTLVACAVVSSSSGPCPRNYGVRVGIGIGS